MYVHPQVMLDARVLRAHLDEVQAEKAAVMAHIEATVDKSVFSSNIKFAELLESYGVEVPMKTSPTTGREIPAIARNDWAFKELVVDESQPIAVQALLAARLSVKSTIEETRTRKMLAQSELCWPMQGKGWAAVPLRYSGARTHRLSGDDGLNYQNFRRGSTIRRAIYAPPGYRIVHRDASQIEARMVAWLAKCIPLMSAFANKRDVYSEFASQVYGKPVTRADTKERFVGKTAILGLGYGCGAAKFRHMLFIGNGGDSYKIELEEATRIVRSYRSTYVEVTELWNSMTLVIEQIIHTQDLMGIVHRATLGGLAASLPVKADNQSILLPNGMKMVYPNIRHYRSGDRIEVCYDDPYGLTQKLYGAKACLGAHTLVLTGRGWVPIVEVATDDVLWDGLAWVQHDGVVCNGQASTILVDGVSMTADHKILTQQGWRDGATCEGLDRAEVWLFDRDAARWVDANRHGIEAAMGNSLRLRPDDTDGLVDLLQGCAEIVRVPPVRDGRGCQPNAWDVETPSLLGLALYDRSLSLADASSVGELRRSGDYGLSRMEVVHCVLGRHEIDLRARADLRAQGQHGWVFTGELSVGNLSATVEQQTKQPAGQDRAWVDNRSRGGAAVRDRLQYDPIPCGSQSQPVYDIVNAGLRNRFVVAGLTGPLIVHNCENVSQALARIIVTDIAVQMKHVTGWVPFLSTHDSLDYCVPEG